MNTSSTETTTAELEQVYAETRHRLALREQLDKAERPWRLHNQAAALLAAARDTIDLALDPDNTEPVTEEHAQRAADLCEMAVEKCAAWLAAERDCAS